jgi:choloylglycine hydrolase
VEFRFGRVRDASFGSWGLPQRPINAGVTTALRPSCRVGTPPPLILEEQIMPGKSILAVVALGAVGIMAMPSWACTGISLFTTDGDPVHARTIEWGGFDLRSKLIVSPRGHAFTSALPMEKRGLSWTSRHGFVGISVSDERFIGEGMNEAGLNAGLFYFKGYGSLAPFDPDHTADNVADMDLVRWMLGQFATVEEVKAALPGITVAPIYIDENGDPSPTAHWRVTDKSGGSIVVEIIDEGEVHVYDNEVGVLTNSPGFPWHLTNLNTVINLQPGMVSPRILGNHEIVSFGGGTASLGLPGDFSPSSRFIRAAFYRSTTPPLETTLDAVSQAFHILANFDIPIGTMFAPDQREHMPDLPSATQWTAVSDLAEGKYYYKTMHDSTIKCVDLGQVDFTTGEERSHAIDEGRFRFKNATP